jgi:hypothetical protein
MQLGRLGMLYYVGVLAVGLITTFVAPASRGKSCSVNRGVSASNDTGVVEWNTLPWFLRPVLKRGG